MWFIFFVAVIGFLISLQRLSDRVTELEKMVQKNVSISAKNNESLPLSVKSTPVLDQSEKVLLRPAPSVATASVPITPVHAPQIRASVLENSDKMEIAFGAKFFTGVGAVAIFFGVGYFLRYAFQNNLISEPFRVAVGVLCGLGFIAGAEYFKNKFINYAAVLAGLGLGLIFVSIYASFGFYHLIPQLGALLGLLTIVAVGIALALRYNLPLLAVYATIGGFLAPQLLVNGQNTPHTLFLYVIILDLGCVAVASWRLWRSLAITSLVGTAITQLLWAVSFYQSSEWVVAEGYASVFFFIFFAIAVAHFAFRKASQNAVDLIFVTLNSVWYFVVSYGFLVTILPHSLGFFTLMLALVHLFAAFIIAPPGEGKGLPAERFRLFLLHIGLTLLTIAIPIQFNAHWITVGWSIEALLLLSLGFSLCSRSVRIFSVGALILVFVRLMLFDLLLSSGAEAWVNNRVLASVTGVVALLGAAILYYRNRLRVEKFEQVVVSLCTVLAGITMSVMGAAEIIQFHPLFWLGIYWSGVSLFLVLFGLVLRNSASRVVGLCVLGGAFLRLIIFDAFATSLGAPFMNTRLGLFVGVAAVCVIIAMLYHWGEKFSVGTTDEINVGKTLSALGAYVLLLVLADREIHDYFSLWWLPVIWAGITVVVIWISLEARMLVFRLVAYVVLFETVMSLLNTENILSAGGFSFMSNRTAAFLLVIAILVAIYKLVQLGRYSLSTDEKKIIAVAVFFTTQGLGIYLVTTELWNYFADKTRGFGVAAAYYRNVQNVLLSVVWTIYAVALLIAGVIRRSRMARLFGAVFLCIVILKVFLFDTASLDTIYKIISFITLGVILLVSGYIYYRYRDRIARFIM